MISFYFYHHYFHMQCNYCSRNYSLFQVFNNLPLVIQKCTNASDYSIFDYSIINFYFFLWFFFFFSSSVLKSAKISLVILQYKRVSNLVLCFWFPWFLSSVSLCVFVLQKLIISSLLILFYLWNHLHFFYGLRNIIK